MANVLDNITDTCDQMGDITLSGVRLEDAHRDLLNVSLGSLDEHVAMQPGAVAYFLSLKKAAKRRLDNAKSAYDRWEKKQYSLAKACVESGCTAKSYIKVEDVKARFVIDNEPEIIKWEKRLDGTRAEYDTLDVWCEAWKQKSFSMREFVEINSDERYNNNDSISNNESGNMNHNSRPRKKETNSVSVDRIRSIIKKNKTRTTAL